MATRAVSALFCSNSRAGTVGRSGTRPVRKESQAIYAGAPVARSSSLAPAQLPKLTLYTGSHCQLCEEAKAVLDELRGSTEAQFELTEYNIRDDSLEDVQRWRRAYQYDIPVLHLEGKEIARHRLDKAEVASRLRILMAERAASR